MAVFFPTKGRGQSLSPNSKLEKVMGNFLLLLLLNESRDNEFDFKVLHSFVLPLGYLGQDACSHSALCFRIRQT